MTTEERFARDMTFDAYQQNSPKKVKNNATIKPMSSTNYNNPYHTSSAAIIPSKMADPDMDNVLNPYKTMEKLDRMKT
jgi:hypothetical protein